MNKEFAKEKENECFQKMVDFNEKLHLQEMGRTPEKWYTDASGITPALEQVSIELKDRDLNLININASFAISGNSNGSTYTGTTIYIESHKGAELWADFLIDGKVPLYINFLNDDVVVCFNMAKLKKRPKTVTKYIRSKLYDGFELSKRMPLELSDAFIYRKVENNYVLIQKPE